MYGHKTQLCPYNAQQPKNHILKYDHLKVENRNGQSLLGNFDEIEAHILIKDIDIMCISESWLLSLTCDRFIEIPGYSVYR